MSHTEEPWVLEKSRPWVIQPSRPSFDWIASVQVSNVQNWEDNARRIVACVNACAGIPTEQLQIEPYLGSVSYNMRMRAEKQCDQFAEVFNMARICAESHAGRADGCGDLARKLLAALNSLNV